MSKQLTYCCDRCKSRTDVASDKRPQDWTRLRRWQDKSGVTIEQDFDLCGGCSVEVNVAIEGLKDETE